MKRWLWYAVVVAAVAFLGGKNPTGSDVGDLQPVQVVRFYGDAGQVVIETDTGAFGKGETLKSALENMKATTASEVFLDTADYLLISKECEGLLPFLTSYLRPSCAVCVTDGAPIMEEVGAYLEIHVPKVTLMRYRAGNQALPVLKTREGRMELVS